MLMVSISAVALLFASCVREGIDLNSDLPKGAIRLSAESFRAANGSKLGVNQYGAQVHFIEGDSIWLNGKIYTVQMSGSTPYLLIDETSRHYTDSIAGKALRAVYPARNVHPDYSFDLANSTTIDLIFPDVFRYRIDPATGRQNVEAPLIAYADANSQEITFKHLTAAITVAISNNTGAPMRLEGIRITNTNGELSIAAGRISNISFSSPDIHGINSNNVDENSKSKIDVTFSNVNCDIPKGGNAYIQVPILPFDGNFHSSWQPRLRIEVLSKNLLPNVIGNRFYFDKTQKAGTAFTISRNELAYAPANMHLDSADLKVDGTYTIDAQGHKVYFAKGNLIFYGGEVSTAATFTASNYNDPLNSSYWAFAPNQYSTFEKDINEEKINTHVNTLGVDGWVSLFLFGANGHGDLSQAVSHHPLAAPPATTNQHDLTSLTRSAGSDWGVRMDDGVNDGWFTLSAEQWQYLLRDDRLADGKPLYNHKSTVHGVKGMIIYPDKETNGGSCNLRTVDFNGFNSSIPSFYSGTEHNTNNVADIYWEKYENGGVVFLPHTGCLYFARSKSGSGGSTKWNPRTQYKNTEQGYYWTSTGGDSVFYVNFAHNQSVQFPTVKSGPYILAGSANGASPSNNISNPKSFAVRLVYPANFDPAELETSNK